MDFSDLVSLMAACIMGKVYTEPEEAVEKALLIADLVEKRLGVREQVGRATSFCAGSP